MELQRLWLMIVLHAPGAEDFVCPPNGGHARFLRANAADTGAKGVDRSSGGSAGIVHADANACRVCGYLDSSSKQITVTLGSKGFTGNGMRTPSGVWVIGIGVCEGSARNSAFLTISGCLEHGGAGWHVQCAAEKGKHATSG